MRIDFSFTLTMTMVEEVSQEIVTSTDTIYSKVRVLVIFSKFCGAFPLKNTLQNDGRKIKFKWTDKIHLWDIAMCITIMYFFISSCSYLIFKSSTNENGGIIEIWLLSTCYIVSIRGLTQFVLVHIYAPRMPKLLNELENYHQIIGASIIKPSIARNIANILTMLWTIIVLIALEIASISFFSQLNSENIISETWPVFISFMFANLWKELPLNLFSLICIYLTARFHEIRDELRELHDKSIDDVGKKIQTLRLQYTALTRIVSLVQRCYGTQLAVNLLFLLIDTVLQLFIFFSVTASRNVYLLVLAVYYFITSVILFAVVDRLERTGEIVADEIAAFDINPDFSHMQNQIQLFLSQLAARPVKISASGFYIINNTLVVSMIGSVATYLVVLIQFAPYFQMVANFTLPSLIEIDCSERLSKASFY